MTDGIPRPALRPGPPRPAKWGVERPLEPPFAFRGNRLTLEGVPLEEIADRFGTPAYVLSETRIRSNIRRFHAAFGGWGPHFRVHYALKANEHPAISRIVRSAGCGADCASPGEIEIARRAGFPPEEIMYTAAYPSRDELDFALRTGVIINLDHPDLLSNLLAQGVPKVLCLRLNPGVRRSGPEGLALGGTRSKFGGSIARAIDAYQVAHRAGVEHFGVHTMLGSNLLDASAFRPTARVLASFIRRFRKETNLPLDFIDTGGGFGVPYRPQERPLDLDSVAQALTRPLLDALREVGPVAPEDRPVLRVEPGRYLVADSGVLLTRVTFVKNDRRRYVGVDAGMSTLLRPALYGAYHAIYPVQSVKIGGFTRADLVGPVCEPADALARGRPLPTLREGDLLALGNAGAYGFSMASHYNGRPLPGEVLVTRGKPFLIRPAGRLSDLTRATRVPRHLR